MTAEPPAKAAASRIPALDLLRGIAVLGILAVNIASFAAPGSASFSPDQPAPASLIDRLAFDAMLVLFEGKMRTLFSILFGASMLLFVERAEAIGRDGARLQVRRLGWLALFGYGHFLLLWDGDILFLYALVGMVALGMRQASPLGMTLAALLLFAGWQGAGLAMWGENVAAERAVRAGTATPAQARLHASTLAFEQKEDDADRAEAPLSLAGHVGSRLADRPFYPFKLVIFAWGETLPMMLIGMALLRSGFFTGQWRRERLWQLALFGLGLGGAATLGFVQWSASNGYPLVAMRLALGFLLGFPHLLMALGYGALVMLAAPRLLASAAGRRLEAAGRAALSNYLGTSLVMVAIFSGWGLGWFGQFGAFAQWGFVLLGWALMLAWSKPWLDRFSQGPFEWLWRSLTEGRVLPLVNLR